MRACCWARIASASTSCFLESGSAVARGGNPGDSIARPIFLCVVDVRCIGAGRRRSSGDVDIEAGGGRDGGGGGGEVGSSFTLLE